MLREIIPIICIMDFNCNDNVVLVHFARFLINGHTSVLASTNLILTCVTSVKLDDFRHFMRSSPDCSNIGSNCVFIYFSQSSFVFEIGYSKLSFPSHLPASAHHLQFLIFIPLSFLRFFFLSTVILDILNRVSEYLISALVKK